MGGHLCCPLSFPLSFRGARAPRVSTGNHTMPTGTTTGATTGATTETTTGTAVATTMATTRTTTGTTTRTKEQRRDPEQQMQKAVEHMKPLVLIVRNGCGEAFGTYVQQLSPHFRIVVPDDGFYDEDGYMRRMIPKVIEKELVLGPELIITNSRGVGYAHEALMSANKPGVAVLVLSSGSPRGPLVLQDHPGRVVCLHGHDDNCTPIGGLRKALETREKKGLEPAVLFEIMNRGHRKKNGWELGGLAQWVLQSQLIQCKHECIYFPPPPTWPNVEEEAKWRDWFLRVCQGDPFQQEEAVHTSRNG